MYNYFKLPNIVFSLKLSSTEIAVAAALYSAKTGYKTINGHIVVVKQSTICNRTGIKCATTVCNAINKLSLLGIIKNIKRRYKSNGQLGTYQYTLSNFVKYSVVDRNVFNYGLSPALLRVYLFLNKCIDKRKKHCWNSYNDIANQLSMSLSRVIEIVKQLINKNLLLCKKIFKSNGSYSDNHYSILQPSVKENKSKKRELPTHLMLAALISLGKALSKYLTCFYIKIISTLCQGFFESFSCFIRGSPKNWGSIYITHYNSHRKRKILYLTNLVLQTGKINKAYNQQKTQNKKITYILYRNIQQMHLLPP